MTMYLGQVFEILSRGHYDRVVIAVDNGYQSELFVLRFDIKDKLGCLEVGDQVAFAGSFVHRDGVKRYALDFIIKQDFKTCEVCRLPSSSADCLMNHQNREAELLSGKWRLIHKNNARGRLNILLEKDGHVIAFSSTSKIWFHTTLESVKVDTLVNILGWRKRDELDLIFLSLDSAI